VPNPPRRRELPCDLTEPVNLIRGTSGLTSTFASAALSAYWTLSGTELLDTVATQRISPGQEARAR
jgi:hypothetical protein